MIRQYSHILKMLLALVGAIVACRLTGGYAIAIVPLFALNYFSKRKPGHVLVCFMFIPFLSMISTGLIGQVWGLGARIAIVVLMVLMVLQAKSRRGSYGLPINILYIYLAVALVASFRGWCPVVSYLKISNFVFFLSAVYFGTRNLHQHAEDLTIARTAMLAFAAFVIIGSVLSMPFPSVCYSMTIAKAKQWGAIGSASQIVADSGLKMFSGVLNHSQTFSPCVVALFCWVLCDMLFVERKTEKLHLVLMGCVPGLLFMSRSRLGLLSFVFCLVIIYFYALPKSMMPTAIKMKFKRAFVIAVTLSIVGAIFLEFHEGTFSKWIRKTNDVDADSRSIGEAMTESRLGKVDMNLCYFELNPMLGMGFQVEDWHQSALDAGEITIYSAPIEKGVLPLMVLGETGVVGAIAFGAFLISFYCISARKRFFITIVMFSLMLVVNMAEAVFFSPGGAGGVFWIICVVGGSVLDMILVRERQQNIQRSNRSLNWGKEINGGIL